MHLGMPTLIENNNIEEIVLLCKELDLDFIELNMNLPEYQIDRLEEYGILQNIADSYGIYFTIHLDENLNFCDFNSKVSEAYFDTMKRTIAVARKLKVPILNIHMNKGVYITLPDSRIYLYSKYKDHYMSKMEIFKNICEEAIGDSDIKISIENTDGFMDFEKSAIEYLLQSNMFSLTWDIGHSHTANNIDENFIIKHVDKLTHFHIHDAMKSKNHMILGTGEIDLNQRIQIAKKYNCRCVVETKTIAALKESIQFYKDKLFS